MLVDETTDVSVIEQLTLCIRYLSGSGENICMNESFLKFIEVQSLTGENLATVILNNKIILFYNNLFFYYYKLIFELHACKLFLILRFKCLWN